MRPLRYTLGVVEQRRVLLQAGVKTTSIASCVTGAVVKAEWVEIWPTSTMEPFAPFINGTPKVVVSRTLRAVGWTHCSLMEGELAVAVAKLKA